MKKLKPMYDRVLVRRVETTETTRESGIVVPGRSGEKPSIGIVVAVGPGRIIVSTGQLQPLMVKPGDEVYFSKHAGHEIEHGGEKLLCLDESNIMATYETEDEPDADGAYRQENQA